MILVEVGHAQLLGHRLRPGGAQLQQGRRFAENMEELRRKVIIELVKNNDALTIVCELWLLSFKMH